MSACLAGAVPQAIVHGNVDLAKQIIMEYKEVFGDDYYLEIQDHGIPEEREVITALLTLSEECGVKLIATNDCHYAEKTKKKHTTGFSVCRQTKNQVRKTDMINDGDYYLKSKEKCWNCFLIALKLSITHRKLWISVNFEFEYGHYRMPKVHIPKKYGNDYLNILKTRPGKVLKRDIHIVIRREQKQSQGWKYELGIIKQMGFAQYFT